MPNAPSSAARAGFQIFLSLGEETPRDEINAALKRAGYPPISRRMYRHYINLSRTGFNRYISINRFDVARASEPYENLSGNSRYKYATSRAGVKVTFPRGRRLVVGYGHTELIGETGLVLVFDDPETVAALKKEATRPRLGESLHIEMLDPRQQVDGRVDDIEISDDKVAVEVEFEKLQSIATYIGRSALDVRDYRMKVLTEKEAQTTVDVIGRQLYCLFEIVESSRSVVNEAAQLTKDDRYAPVADVRRLSFSSPLEAILGIPDAVAYVIYSALSALSFGIAYQRLRRKRLENNSLEIENQVKAAKAKYEEKKAELGTEVLAVVQNRLKLSEGLKETDLTTLKQLTSAIDALSEQEISGAELARPKSSLPKGTTP